MRVSTGFYIAFGAAICLPFGFGDAGFAAGCAWVAIINWLIQSAESGKGSAG